MRIHQKAIYCNGVLRVFFRETFAAAGAHNKLTRGYLPHDGNGRVLSHNNFCQCRINLRQPALTWGITMQHLFFCNRAANEYK